MIYIFRIRPFVRLFFVVILLWVGWTCMETGRAVMFGFGLLMFFIAGFICCGLFRLSRGYLHTWHG